MPAPRRLDFEDVLMLKVSWAGERKRGRKEEKEEEKEERGIDGFRTERQTLRDC